MPVSDLLSIKPEVMLAWRRGSAESHRIRRKSQGTWPVERSSGMTRSKSAAAWMLLGMLGLSVPPAARPSISPSRWASATDRATTLRCRRAVATDMAARYGPGAPFCSAQRGCCEVPASWRLHVWDNYRGDRCTWHTSFCGVPKPGSAGYGYGFGSAGCPTCQPSIAPPPAATGYAIPASAPTNDDRHLAAGAKLNKCSRPREPSDN